MENNTKKRKESSSWLIPAGLLLIFLAGVILLIFLLNGQTTITGEFEGQKNSETLVCESDEVSYPIFEYDNSDSKSLKVNAIFEDEKLTSISLYYKLNYSSEEEMKQSEASNHADMNLSFYDDEMEADALDAKYSFLDNSLQMSIYAKGDDLNQKTLRYFMLLNVYDVDSLTKEKMAKVYSGKGLDCVIKYNETKEEVNEN